MVPDRGGHRAVWSETATKTETFCGAVRCGFEAKTAMKPNRLVWFGAISNGFGLVLEKKMYNLKYTHIYALDGLIFLVYTNIYWKLNQIRMYAYNPEAYVSHHPLG